MHVNAEVIFYGGTDPRAKVTIDGKPITLNPDGSFRYHFIFPDGVYEIPIVAISPDGVESRSAVLRFERGTQKTGKVDDTSQPPLAPSDGFRLLKEKPPSLPVTAPSRRGRPAHATIPALSRRREKCLAPYPDELSASPFDAFQSFGLASPGKCATADDFRAFLFHLMKSGRARSSIRLAFSGAPQLLPVLGHSQNT